MHFIINDLLTFKSNIDLALVNDLGDLDELLVELVAREPTVPIRVFGGLPRFFSSCGFSFDRCFFRSLPLGVSTFAVLLLLPLGRNLDVCFGVPIADSEIDFTRPGAFFCSLSFDGGIAISSSLSLREHSPSSLLGKRNFGAVIGLIIGSSSGSIRRVLV